MDRIEGGPALQPVTILVRYDNEYGEQEMRYPGFLTGDLHAMYLEDYKRLLFISVENTDDPAVFLETSGHCMLGILDESQDQKSVIEALATILHSLTAYEFMMKVVVHVRTEIEFEDWIVPKLISEMNGGETLNEGGAQKSE